jgi:hypothetical protein
MANQLKAGETPSESQLNKLVQSLSDWAELEVLPNARLSRSLQRGSPYSARLANLHAARRALMVRIEDDQRMGLSTVELEQELEAKRLETRSFLAYLEFHAKSRV